MNEAAMADVVQFAQRWIEAGPHVVQFWPLWEARASTFFRSPLVDEDLFHGVMLIVCYVCFGDADAVKSSLREATPRVIAACTDLLGHLQQFAVVLEAETRFRRCQLATDWTVQSEAGKIVVRSEFRVTDGTEH